MIRLRTTLFTFMLMGSMPNYVSANEHHDAAHEPDAPKAEAKNLEGAVVALNTKSGKSVKEGDLIDAGPHVLALTDRDNRKFELSPHSVASFENGGFRLLRGSALAESSRESVLRTGSARIDFVGKVAMSYDFKEHSTSAFVLEGEARMVNPGSETQSLRLERFRGAALEVGEVLPRLIRSLDVGGVKEWLEGYAWPDENVVEMLKGMPEALAVETPRAASHLATTRLEDYFSAVDGPEELGAPDYYEKKFQDPDQSMAEAKNKKSSGNKSMSPESAALIALPNTGINLGFDLPPEVISADQKEKEVWEAMLKNPPKKRAPASVKPSKRGARGPASVAAKPENGDPTIDAVLARLRKVSSREPVISGPSAPGGRGPSSVNTGSVPDPVYDFSQNF